jgi:hypothetical protein
VADLTTLAAVKAYLGLTSNGIDSLISSLIVRETTAIQDYTSRKFPAVTQTAKRLNGTGSKVLVLPDSPVLDVSYLAIEGVEVPVSADGLAYGYQFDDTALYMVASKFPSGRQNVVCSWTAGYQESETAFIPSANTPTLTPTTGGRAATNISVTDANGPMTLVGNGPVAGQYTFTAGTYTFNAANIGDSVTMAYYYVPGPVEQSCIELVAQDLKSRDNVGIKSKSLAGEVITYSSDGMSTGVQQTLKLYRKLAPA